MAERKEYKIAIHFVNGESRCFSFDGEQEFEYVWTDLNNIDHNSVLFFDDCVVNFRNVLFVERVVDD